MVLDPLSAFAVACNVIQVVEVGFKILSKAADYRQSNDGQTTEQRELRDVARTLGNLTSSLQASLGDAPESYQASSEASRLIEANNECLKLSREFTHFLDKLKVKDRHATLESLRMSIKARWYKDRINAMQQALSEARNNLNIAFLLYMHAQQTVILGQTKDRVERSATNVEQNILNAINSSSGHLQDEILKLAEHLKETYLDSGEQTATEFVSNNQDIFGEITTQLRAMAIVQKDAASLRMEDRLLAAQQKILDSLHFGQIHDRREQIRAAYSQTYQWMLQPLSQGWRSWDCFITWTQSSDSHKRLYWIHGKPGSGKSTLMRFLDDNLRKDNHMSAWAKDNTVFKACCYFWTAGNTLQRSLQGLYRSLLFQLLEKNRSMISKIVSQRDWKAAQVSGYGIAKEWTSSELRNMLTACVDSLQGGTKIFFLIDGLDEFEGIDEEQDDLVDYLLSLADSENVKICVSSRPLNVFRDAFGHFPQLRLEDLTRGDIEMYTMSQLASNNRWHFFEERHLQDARALTTEIVVKASGVFLWVRLVVRDLLKGLRDGDGLRQLRQKLELIPADLDDYFLSIVNSIEPNHRREASALLQLALFRETKFTSLLPLSVMDISFIEEDEAFAVKPGYDVCCLDLLDHQSSAFRFDSTVRKLNSRSMGLLEVCPSSDKWRSSGTCETHRNFSDIEMEDIAIDDATRGNTNHDPRGAVSFRGSLLQRVEFLHRSLHDFLLTDKMQAFLHQHTNGPFNARAFLCSTRFIQFLAVLRTRHGDTFAIRLASHLLSALSVDRTTAVSVMMTTMLEEPMTEMAERTIHIDMAEMPWYICQSLDNWQFEGSTFLTMAIDFNLTSYVLPRLTPQIIKNKVGRPIIDYILRPLFLDDGDLGVNNRWPDAGLLKTALENGADPNQICSDKRASVWALFLSSLWVEVLPMSHNKYLEAKQTAYFLALELMINAGALPLLQQSAFYSIDILAEFGYHLPLDPYWVSARTACDRWQGRQLEVTSAVFDADQELYDHYYAVSDVLQILNQHFIIDLGGLIQSLRRKEPEEMARMRQDRQQLWLETSNKPVSAGGRNV